MKNKVIIAGAGPGAEDLITLRAAEALKKADVVIYAGSLVNPAVLDLCREKCERFNSAGMSLDDVIVKIEESVKKGLKVVRLHSGDPAVYGAISEQMNELERRNIEFEVIPGVSCAFAAAAALQCEYTMPGISQSIILTRRAGRTPVPEKENLKKLAANDAVVVLYLSVADIEGAVQDFIDAGRSYDTPAAVVYRASWPNQKIIRGTLKDIAGKVREAEIKRQALIIVGKVLDRQGEKSLLYDKTFAHGYRRTSDKDLFQGRCAVYAVTEQGGHKAVEIAGGLSNADVFLPERFSEKFTVAEFFKKGAFEETLRNNWENYDAHIFVMAAGIAVRKTAPLIKSKLTDPAVIVCDELGSNIVSLLSGHIGGANRLAELIAGITGGKAVITTATDVNKLKAFDELAALNNWRIENPEMIKTLNSMLLERGGIDILIPEDIFEKFYSSVRGVQHIKNREEISGKGIVSLDFTGEEPDIPHLRLSSKIYYLGIGCRKGTSCKEIEEGVSDALEKGGIGIEQIAGIGTGDVKKEEKGLLEFADKYGLDLKFFTAEELNSCTVPNPSAKAEEHLGINSVSEAAAMLISGNSTLVLTKKKYPKVTVACAKWSY